MNTFLDAGREGIHLLISGDPYVTEVLRLSLRVSGIAILAGALLGLPVGTFLALKRFPGRIVLVALLHTGFALPPVVVGLLVYMFLSNSGPAASLHLLFTPGAMIISQTVLAAPYIAGITLAAVQAVAPDVHLQARAIGLSRLHALYLHVREARLGIIAAFVAGFGAIFSEVGSVLMVGGNIRGETRVLTTAVVLETRRGNYALALALSFILLAIAFSVNVVLTRAQQTATFAERRWS